MTHYLPWRYGNLVLRASLGIFLALWGADKLVAPADTIKIFEHFYKMQLDASVATIVGIAEVCLGLAIAGGFFRTFSYGLGLALHLISTLSSWQQLLDPWGKIWNQGKNSHLFLASIPVLAAFVVLFMNRSDEDFTLDRLLRRKR